MRVVEAQAYRETRDALSHDWYVFARSYGMVPVLLPNAPGEAAQYAANLQLQGIILTGGNNVAPQTCGDAPGPPVDDAYVERDETEAVLIDYAIDAGLSVLGVCRGMQMLNVHFGGRLLRDIRGARGTTVNHVAATHPVDLAAPALAREMGSRIVEVNSFHNQGLAAEQLSGDFVCFALSEADGIVEGMVHCELPIIGVQWHPERRNPGTGLDRALVKRFLAVDAIDSLRSAAG